MSWFKIHSEAEHSTVWRNINAWRLLEWCLMHAAYQAEKTSVGNIIIPLERGQLVFTYRNAEYGTGLTMRVLRNALQFLILNETISVKTTNKFSIVTIVNYRTYQDGYVSEGKPATNKRQTNDKQTTHYIETTETTEEQKPPLAPLSEGCKPRIAEKTQEGPLVASEVSQASGCTINTQTLNQEPAKRQKKAIPENVKAVLDDYRDKVKFIDKTRSRAKGWIATILKREPLENLLKSIDNYLLACEADGTEEKFRRGVGNFFGKDREWEDYLDDELMEGIEGEAKRKKFRDAIGIDIPVQDDADLEALEAEAIRSQNQ